LLEFSSAFSFLLKAYDYDLYDIGEMLWILGYHEVLMGNFLSNAATDELIQPFIQNYIEFDEISVNYETDFLSIEFKCSDQNTSTFASMIDQYPYDNHLLSRLLEPPNLTKDGVSFKFQKADDGIVELIQKIEDYIEELFVEDQTIVISAIRDKFKEVPIDIEILIENIHDKKKLQEIHKAISQFQTLDEFKSTI